MQLHKSRPKTLSYGRLCTSIILCQKLYQWICEFCLKLSKKSINSKIPVMCFLRTLLLVFVFLCFCAFGFWLLFALFTFLMLLIHLMCLFGWCPCFLHSGHTCSWCSYFEPSCASTPPCCSCPIANLSILPSSKGC